MSLDSEYNKMKEFTNLLTNFKNLKPKNPKQYVDELYEKYYNAYKNNYDGDELREAKKKKIDYKQFELFDKTDKKLALDRETKIDEESKLIELPKWLHSKNDFKRAIKDMN